MKTSQKRGKAQVQMGETIAILFVFFFLVIIGMVFYVNVIKSKSAAAKDENSQLEAVSALKRAISLPELSCSRQDISTSYCVDLLKLNAASGIMPKNQEHYFDLLGFSVVSIQEIYPQERTYPLYNSSLEKFTSKSSSSTPISLLDPVSDSSAFGIIQVETYSR